VLAAYSAFQAPEFSARMRRAREALRGGRIVACLSMAPEHLYYLGGYDSWVAVNSPQALVFTPKADPPTLLLRNVDLPLARETSWLDDIRTYDLIADNFALRVAAILGEKGIESGRVAVELASYAVPAQLADSLRQALPGVELVDATRLLGDLRHVKSKAELAYMESAAAYANLGLAAMVDAVEPGVSEISVAAAIENAMRAAGGDYWAIPTELASGERSAGGHATPRHKLLACGDLLHAEFAGVAERYHATAIQTLACGEPAPRARELYDIALASLRAGMQAATPGAAVAALEEASLLPLRAHGLEGAAMMRFGYGVGIAYPPIWLETLQIARGFDFTLEPGMAFVLHSCLELPDERIGVIQGGTWVMEPGGIRLLAGAGDCPLLVL
jgi:Xaa-Pro aminopeptidase